METHINTYKLNQKNKEYILRICMVGDSIRINCVNITNGTNSEFRRDFTLEELKNLDNIFDIIKTPYEALDYMDRALKIQKVGMKDIFIGNFIRILIEKENLNVAIQEALEIIIK